MLILLISTNFGSTLPPDYIKQKDFFPLTWRPETFCLFPVPLGQLGGKILHRRWKKLCSTWARGEAFEHLFAFYGTLGVCFSNLKPKGLFWIHLCKFNFQQNNWLLLAKICFSNTVLHQISFVLYVCVILIWSVGILVLTSGQSCGLYSHPVLLVSSKVFSNRRMFFNREA